MQAQVAPQPRPHQQQPVAPAADAQSYNAPRRGTVGRSRAAMGVDIGQLLSGGQGTLPAVSSSTQTGLPAVSEQQLGVASVVAQSGNCHGWVQASAVLYTLQPVCLCLKRAYLLPV